MLALFPSSALTRVSGHPHTSFPEFQQEVKVKMTCGTSFHARGIWLSPLPAYWSWHEHTFFFLAGGGAVWEGPSWSVLMDFSVFFSRLIRVEDSWKNWKASWNMAMSDSQIIPQRSVEIQRLNAKRLQWAQSSQTFQAIQQFLKKNNLETLGSFCFASWGWLFQD